MIVFMPMLGFGLAVSSLVGRYLGAERPDVAERAGGRRCGCASPTWACSAPLPVRAPLLLAPYGAGADRRAGGCEVTSVLLRFVAFYSLFDMMNVLAAALKGAGDTTYPVVATVVLAWGVMLVPTWVVRARRRGLHRVDGGEAYIFCVGLLMYRRFRPGRWRSMRVIEAAPLEA